MLAVQVAGPDGQQSARVIEISARGLRISSLQQLSPGHAVVVRRAGLDIPGRVIWVQGCRAGVKFDNQIDEQAYLRFRSGSHRCLHCKQLI
jgi:hypothetical protein